MLTSQDVAVGDLSTLIAPFERSLRAQRKSKRTIETYGQSARQLLAFLQAQGMPTQASKLTREHVESFIETLVEKRKPATANNRYRGLQQWFKWLLEEGEITTSPMARMKPPKVPEELVPVVDDQDIHRLLKTVDADRTFEGRRDAAMIRMLLDSGMRNSELIGLDLAAVDIDEGVAWVRGKDDRPRGAPFGSKSAVALDRYLRQRAQHPHRTSRSLWIGPRGPVTDSGVRQIIEKRCLQAGIPYFNPHRLRHTFADRWLGEGNSEGDLMRLLGWKSRQMVLRYANSTGAERARRSYKRAGFGDRY
jgi:site-specific recombinase XerD